MMDDNGRWVGGDGDEDATENPGLKIARLCRTVRKTTYFCFFPGFCSVAIHAGRHSRDILLMTKRVCVS